ncbi:hypothetical protein CYMTET_49853 [Cymbomonas tetramitiformis]|uniref:Uncharacterized protein n=1 Tax=Cymbomonas tetramitiformis TaxID=36881 RepID=A0AAE0BRC4_9CHLO|nr:hypothetical protein CYMTET_49853 [Cymbomonas tetramitiformis]
MSTRQVSAKPTRQVGRNARRSRIAGTARASHEGTARRTYDGAGLRGKTEDESGGLPSALVIRNFLKENRHLLEESRTTGFPDQTAETAEQKVTDDDSEDVTEEVWNGEIVPAEEVSGRQPREDYRRSHDGIVRRSNGREQTGLSPAAAPARYSCDLGQRHARVDVAQRLLTSWHKVNPFKSFTARSPSTPYNLVPDDDSEDAAVEKAGKGAHEEINPLAEELDNFEIVPAEEVSGRLPREDYRRSHDGIVRRSNGREQTGLSPAAAPARYSCDLGQRYARVDVAQRLLTSWHKVNPFKPFTARSPSTPYNLVPDDDSQDVTEEVGNGEILPAEEVSGRLPREDNFGSHEGEPFRCPRGKQVAVQSSVDQHRHPDAKSPLRKKVENIEMTSLESRE